MNKLVHYITIFMERKYIEKSLSNLERLSESGSESDAEVADFTLEEDFDSFQEGLGAFGVIDRTEEL